MQQDYTEIAVVLDRSGSMVSTKTDAEGGFNHFIDEQRKVPGRCNVSLMQFDTTFESVYASRPISDVPKLELLPRGGTALLDAIGKTINELGARLATMPEADRPGKVILLIVTDGEENSSKEFTYAKIDELIRQQRDAYQWNFIFIGANQDAIATAAKIGIGADASLTYANNAAGNARAYASTSSLVGNLRTGKGPQGFTAKDRDEQRAVGSSH
jgi:uncharacterized protein with von Willebrand factor type A (vWA) domain